jgi:hypothetical protein
VGRGAAVENLKQVTVGQHHIGMAEQHGLPQQMELLIAVEFIHLILTGGEGGELQTDQKAAAIEA